LEQSNYTIGELVGGLACPALPVDLSAGFVAKPESFMGISFVK
jgi:hypothetical protein